MSVGSISSTAAVATASAIQTRQEAKPSQGEMPVDKVSISPEALKAAATKGGDVDHDGDQK